MRLLSVLYIILALRFASTGNGDDGRLRRNSSTYSSFSEPTSPRDISQFVKPESPPKYFGIDIDGTLHTNNKESFEKNIEAFAEVRKKGYTPFFCTGRSLTSAMNVVGEEFKTKTGYNGYPGVYNDGSIVYDKDGNLIYSKPFSNTVLEAITERLVAENLKDKCLFCTKDAFYSLAELDQEFQNIFDSLNVIFPRLEVIGTILDIGVAEVFIQSRTFDIPGLERGVDYVEKYVGVDGIALSPPGITKGSAFSTLIKHSGGKPEDYGFIGDGDNDTEAMEFCNVSFAVGNSPDEVKKHAKWVLEETCDQGAVAKALKLTYDL
ncbi:haloacid dehalogenase-like hydrolase family member protein [Theileria equi strain WA]|uniref:Haloacid dehalogenase-like hydrolase family member protein n=1 Tax=Theileria equi strain WA TaxID=1537102 RepID=L0B0B4_THEEQ|nr:haloacid dehalogenase-like hydrolase family member protein [Theileria equi strain WA]AFZ80706.1 haloacid dehalogenase-like hydrolase family member protein [Theileria equi strain WA]|eukprot:XP_004830372.1 haloacid dehalogenase-like hydrolase family member protein [Theileria equi strain WA]